MLRNQAAKEMGRYLDNDFEWHADGTFTTQYFMSKKSARRLIENLHQVVQRKIGNLQLTTYWVAERGPFADDYHLHALFSADTKPDNLIAIIEDAWLKVSRTKRVQSENRFTVDPFEKGDGACSYLTKQLSMREVDYDFILPDSSLLLTNSNKEKDSIRCTRAIIA